MRRFRIMRLEVKGWDLVAEITATVGTAFSVAEHASSQPTPARVRVEDTRTDRILAVFEGGACVELVGKPFP